MPLKSTSVNINEDVWYYEDKAGIDIVHWVTERDGYRKAYHIKISWRKLAASVSRKSGASQQSVQRTATPSQKSSGLAQAAAVNAKR